MSGFLVLSAIVAAAVAVWLLRSSRRSSKPTTRPKFKDFRYSGSTYEESYEKYLEALHEYQERTGRE
jgi:hypothetical protein